MTVVVGNRVLKLHKYIEAGYVVQSSISKAKKSPPDNAQHQPFQPSLVDLHGPQPSQTLPHAYEGTRQCWAISRGARGGSWIIKLIHGLGTRQWSTIVADGDPFVPSLVGVFMDSNHCYSIALFQLLFDPKNPTELCPSSKVEVQVRELCP